MITNIQQASYDSAVIDSTLVPIMPGGAMNPVTVGIANIGLGAGANTLPGSTVSGSGVATGNIPSANSPPGGNLGSTISNMTTPPSGTIFGIPAVGFWIVFLGAIAYLILWKVHFHASLSEG